MARALRYANRSRKAVDGSLFRFESSSSAVTEHLPCAFRVLACVDGLDDDDEY